MQFQPVVILRYCVPRHDPRFDRVMQKKPILLYIPITFSMSEPKTKPMEENVENFLNAVEHPQKKKDSFELLKTLKEITKEEPTMWGSSIVGFGSVHYKYASGREGDWPITGFSPRKRSLTVYIMPGFEDFGDLLEKLGKHKVGKSSLYINKLADVDTAVLKELIKKSIGKPNPRE